MASRAAFKLVACPARPCAIVLARRRYLQLPPSSAFGSSARRHTDDDKVVEERLKRMIGDVQAAKKEQLKHTASVPLKDGQETVSGIAERSQQIDARPPGEGETAPDPSAEASAASTSSPAASSSSSSISSSSSDRNTQPTLSSLLTSLPKVRSSVLSHPSVTALHSSISSRLASSRARVSTELSQLATRLSKVTGYEAIDILKASVVDREAALREVRQGAGQLKRAYAEAVDRRAESMREVNDLLSRKGSWSDSDLARFTTLVRTDHANEQAELQAKKALDEVEAKVDTEFTGLMQAILSRYHEEQIWSDKIRSLSTTFSLSITVINVLVFLLAIVLVEPYKRAKVVEGVETRMTERDAQKTAVIDRALGEVVGRLTNTELRLEDLVGRIQLASGASAALATSPPAPTAAEPSTAIPPPAVPAEDGDSSPAPQDLLLLPVTERQQELGIALGAGAALGALAVGLIQLFWSAK